MTNNERLFTAEQTRTSETLAYKHQYAVLMPYSQNLRHNGNQRLSFYSAFAANAVAELHRKGHIGKIILCGETTFGQNMKTTSGLQKEALIRMGIPEADIIVLEEPNLDNTAVQIKAVAEFQRTNKLTNEKFLVVDWRFHDERVKNHIKGFRLNAETVVAEDVRKLLKPTFNQKKLEEVLPAEFEAREKMPRKISRLDRRGLVPRLILMARGPSVTDIRHVGHKKSHHLILESSTGKKKLKEARLQS